MINQEVKDKFLSRLRQSPTIKAACRSAGIDRKTYYNWVKKNNAFAKQCDEAIQEGRESVCDNAESQIFDLIGEKKIDAIKFYLTHNNPRYSNKLELSGKVDLRERELTKEQMKIIRKLKKISPLKIHEKE